MTPDELLRSIAATLRSDIGPAIADEYPRTQAFMAAVVLERVAQELALSPMHAEADAGDAAALHQALVPILRDAPEQVVDGLDRLAAGGSLTETSPLIEALYGWGIDEPAATEALAVVRRYLRRDIDRRMAIAR